MYKPIENYGVIGDLHTVALVSIDGSLDCVCENWRRPDEGIWEMREEQRHFVYSKLMWRVALDRALRLADKRSVPVPRSR